MNTPNPDFMREAIALSRHSILSGQGGPFGAVIVKNGQIIARGHNQVTSTHDPTAHAEVVVIRNACQQLQTFQLQGCELYTSCEPCPMCLGAIYWSRIDCVYFANRQEDAAQVGFDDHFIYQEFNRSLLDRQLPMQECLRSEALAVFQTWVSLEAKVKY